MFARLSYIVRINCIFFFTWNVLKLEMKFCYQSYVKYAYIYRFIIIDECVSLDDFIGLRIF
jgi:hypothetical protein